jgi:hypothetical protein
MLYRNTFCGLSLPPLKQTGSPGRVLQFRNVRALGLKFLSVVLFIGPPAMAHAEGRMVGTASQEAIVSTKEKRKPGKSESPPPKKPSMMVPPEKAQPVRVLRFETAPVIDGKLDDAVWKNAALFRDFYQIQPGDNIAPSKQTEVKVGYDSKFLYIAFKAFDDPEKVRSTLAKRDSVFDDDFVGVYLDTFNDRRRAYELIFNPLGIQADAIYTETQGEDFSVDIVMDSKGVVGSEGYTVEAAIPFKSLRYEAGKDKLWGIHFFRKIKRLNDEQDSWMPLSRDLSGNLNQAGHITGMEGISTEHTLELIPSLTLSETGKRTRTVPQAAAKGIIDNGRFVNDPLGFDPGLTLKYGITPTVTFDLALNPDFAQVEADAPVVVANQRFPIFFPEKRPFFLEGVDIFQTLISAVNTRTIVDPDYAAKLTGKRGRNTFGVLVASDNAPGNFSQEELDNPEDITCNQRPQDADTRACLQRYLHKNSLVSVIRLKHDVGSEGNIGFLATTYDFIDQHNKVAGFDGRFRVNKTTTFDAQVLGTTARAFFYDPIGDKNDYRTGNGAAYSFDLNDNGRHWGYEFSGTGRTRDYREYVGFTRRVNTNNEILFVRYNSEPKPKAKVTSWRVFNFSSTNFDWKGRSQNFWNESQFRINLQKRSFLAIGVEKGYERIFEEEFGRVRTATRSGQFAGNDSERSTYRKTIYFYGGTTPSKKYSAFALAIFGRGAFDYDFGAGSRFPRVSPGALLDPNAPQDPGPGKSFHLESNLAYQPTDALRFTLDYTHDSLRRNDTQRLAFVDNIYTLRGTYQFTRFLAARARVDYDTLSASVKGQFLFGWTPNPGTSFYVGYNDDLNRNGFNPFSGKLEPGFRRNGRTFFIKVSYLIRKSFG